MPEPFSIFTKKHQLKQIENSFHVLKIDIYKDSDDQSSIQSMWSEFFRFYIPMCLDSTSYRAGLLGLGDIKADGAYRKLITERDTLKRGMDLFEINSTGYQAFIDTYSDTLDAVVLP